jgi:hypothetical protein
MNKWLVFAQSLLASTSSVDLSRQICKKCAPNCSLYSIPQQAATVGIRVGMKIAAVAVQLRVHVAGVGGCKQPQ